MDGSHLIMLPLDGPIDIDRTVDEALMENPDQVIIIAPLDENFNPFLLNTPTTSMKKKCIKRTIDRRKPSLPPVKNKNLKINGSKRWKFLPTQLHKINRKEKQNSISVKLGKRKKVENFPGKGTQLWKRKKPLQNKPKTIKGNAKSIRLKNSAGESLSRGSYKSKVISQMKEVKNVFLPKSKKGKAMALTSSTCTSSYSVTSEYPTSQSYTNHSGFPNSDDSPVTPTEQRPNPTLTSFSTSLNETDGFDSYSYKDLDKNMTDIPLLSCFGMNNKLKIKEKGKQKSIPKQIFNRKKVDNFPGKRTGLVKRKEQGQRKPRTSSYRPRGVKSAQPVNAVDGSLKRNNFRRKVSSQKKRTQKAFYPSCMDTTLQPTSSESSATGRSLNPTLTSDSTSPLDNNNWFDLIAYRDLDVEILETQTPSYSSTPIFNQTWSSVPMNRQPPYSDNVTFGPGILDFQRGNLETIAVKDIEYQMNN